MKNSVNAPMIIQFMHPGNEHSYKKGETFKPQNNKKHERNFICTDGSYIDKSDNKKNDTLCFWGEWENKATAVAIGAKDKSGIMPHHLITPTPVVPPERAANTDPFVFGDGFKYFCCQQHDNGALTKLNKGDIILFGSCKQDRFLIDTLFVVAKAISYSTGDYDDAKKATSENDFKLFFNNSFVTMAEAEKTTYTTTCNNSCNEKSVKGSCGRQKISRVLYIGATPDNPVEGMYSFVPAMKKGDCPNGFSRPVISKKEVPDISPKLHQGFNSKIDASNRLAIWNNIRSAVLSAGYVLGVHFELK